MKARRREKRPSRDFTFWRAYLEILSERVPRVDRWDDGSITWHPRVVRKLLWYSNVPNTPRDRVMVYDWLMCHVAEFQPDKSSNADDEINGTPQRKKKLPNRSFLFFH
jgi:hypothetical protein